jgi:hypothetical protein
MSKNRLSQFCGRAIVVSLAVSCAIVFLSLTNARAQPASLFDDGYDGNGNGYYCPASQHSCGTYGTSYFAPDPYDVGAACDHQFLSWNGSTIDPDSCYGQCNQIFYNTGDVPLECYANCQGGTDGLGGYSGCLRGAFGIGPRPTPVGGGDPRVIRNLSGMVFRNCLIGVIPAIHQEEYDSCIGSGGTVEDCCTVVANHFP